MRPRICLQINVAGFLRNPRVDFQPIEDVILGQAELSGEYDRILNRDRAKPDWIDAGRAKSTAELHQRLLARRAKSAINADRQ